MLGQLLNLSVPQFLHMKNRDNGTHLTEMLKDYRHTIRPK